MTFDPDQLLQNVNDILAPLEKQCISKFTKPHFPVVIIIGAPRSGHTLLSQLLAASGGFGYVSNFVARFWSAPYIGAQIELALGIRQLESMQRYSSEYGRTTGWIGPHEFGNFLRRFFTFTETHKVELDKLPKEDEFTRELAALESVYEKPLFLRNIIYGLNISLLSKTALELIFVVCRRSVLYQAQSILIARQTIHGDKEKWWSLRPKEYDYLKRLPYWQQIIGQIYYTYREIESGLAEIESSRRLDIHYSDLCANPRREVRRIIESVELVGGIDVDWDPERLPQAFESKDFQRINDVEFERLREACALFFPDNESSA